MRHGAVTAKIEIPFVIPGNHFVAAHIFLENIEPLLALTAADDLADARNQQVHRGHGFAIIVQPHVKRLNLLRKIENRYRTFEMLFGQPALMLRLQVQSVLDRELEFFATLL